MFNQLSAALVVVFASFAAVNTLAPDSPLCKRSYTVHTGDTCDSISKEQNVSSYQLTYVNPVTIDATCSGLIPNVTQLCLAAVNEDCSALHVVVPGDYMYKIGRTYGIGTNLIHVNNPNINAASVIYPGQVLCIANTTVSYKTQYYCL